ncbi:hypothetical protein AMES_2883 [Amycolatopsis mediterranei S699]|uniref:Secreted protein n=2 Tax=Amycolatopsis mediterranei TaxID=33910 RepID=A0A0H3D593_AMYMU|nr:hypothetical protein [Amycolatopsis mediterranei]ADJ44708.1 hypothetical protein AMED_2914 [Amycolatopsis mediterranei U32]AEK41450.1 hypothetical protein RAM_14810 [Amycolatopsis mediterranei S699]AFO76419.1 hypothetical protein AMES_2883 [Amycolatopsis mediterranei S699]AGT83548.1 hypothetical protein B737_2884 [Amycolatopsis mediterranei RB]KDO07469.1 hypothetical protein DV26_29730 [Amycolatopsis mediterranei]
MGKAMRVGFAAVLAAVTSGSVLVGSAAAATETSSGWMLVQGTCGDTFQPRVNGGEAGWTVICGGGTVRANGWVKDTKADGKGAEVYGGWGDGADFGTVRTGGKGSIARFDKSHAGSVVNLWLRVI